MQRITRNVSSVSSFFAKNTGCPNCAQPLNFAHNLLSRESVPLRLVASLPPHSSSRSWAATQEEEEEERTLGIVDANGTINGKKSLGTSRTLSYSYPHSTSRQRSGSTAPSTNQNTLGHIQPSRIFQMISTQIFRLIHTDSIVWQATNKSLLAKLRKKTGYTFSNCKKALEIHQNDIAKAEIWLKEQAQAHGWTQAAKLEGRSTRQGLIAVMVDENRGAVVEINCETDFVARNKRFHGLAETVVTAVLNHAPILDDENLIRRNLLHADALKSLPGSDGKSLADHTALTIGSVGENISIRRALGVTVHPKVSLFGCTHPEPVNPVPISFGRYGALVALTRKEGSKTVLGTQLCQHIIGMNPRRIGNPSVDTPNGNVDSETCMIYQEFLLDPTLSVQQVLINAQVDIVDFARFEMGETLETEQRTLDSIETCG